MGFGILLYFSVFAMDSIGEPQCVASLRITHPLGQQLQDLLRNIKELDDRLNEEDEIFLQADEAEAGSKLSEAGPTVAPENYPSLIDVQRRAFLSRALIALALRDSHPQLIKSELEALEDWSLLTSGSSRALLDDLSLEQTRIWWQLNHVNFREEEEALLVETEGKSNLNQLASRMKRLYSMSLNHNPRELTRHQGLGLFDDSDIRINMHRSTARDLDSNTDFSHEVRHALFNLLETRGIQHPYNIDIKNSSNAKLLMRTSMPREIAYSREMSFEEVSCFEKTTKIRLRAQSVTDKFFNDLEMLGHVNNMLRLALERLQELLEVEKISELKVNSHLFQAEFGVLEIRVRREAETFIEFRFEGSLISLKVVDAVWKKKLNSLFSSGKNFEALEEEFIRAVIKPLMPVFSGLIKRARTQEALVDLLQSRARTHLRRESFRTYLSLKVAADNFLALRTPVAFVFEAQP